MISTLKRHLVANYFSGTEATLPTLSHLSILRDNSSRPGVVVEAKEAWFEYDNQKWVLEGRLILLVKSHMQDVENGKDTSFSVLALTMAFCDVVYWKGMWEVVRSCDEEFKVKLESLAQVVSLIFFIAVSFSIFGKGLDLREFLR
jgi:hypothetical protein